MAKITVPALPPKFLDPSHRPKFLSENRGGLILKPPDEVPRSVAAAAVVALAKPHGRQRAMTPPPAHRDPELQLRRGRQGHTTQRGNLAIAPWPRPLGIGGNYEHFQVANEPIALTAVTASDASKEDQDNHLYFGDNIRLLRQGDDAALSTVPPGCAPDTEKRLTRQLMGSGREPEGFVAVSAVLPRETKPGSEKIAAPPASRRNIWELYRGNPIDGYAGNAIHYGQLLRIGQRPGASWPCHFGHRDEVLLSCEPPMAAGGEGTPYLVLGRTVSFGRPNPHDDGKKLFGTLFYLLPIGSQHYAGEPVTRTAPVLLVPAGPAAYLHKPRCIHVAPGGCNSSGRQVRTMEALSSFGEFALEASVMTPPVAIDSPGQRYGSDLAALYPLPGHEDVVLRGWRVERVALAPGSFDACLKIRKEAHTGFPRALLGRALQTPPFSILDDAATAAICQDSQYARWERIRSILLPRFARRGTFAFATFRKTLSIPSKSVLVRCDQHATFRWAASLASSADSGWPGASDPPADSERCYLHADDMAHLLSSEYGVELVRQDIDLIIKTWGIGGKDAIEQGLIDADMFCDALRGEPSPGRHQCLSRLYAELQRDLGVDEHDSLDSEWVATRLWQCRPREKPGVRLPPFTPDQLMGAFPLLRSHSALSRSAFIRCTSDLAFAMPSHAEFSEFISRVWGCASQARPEETVIWNLTPSR